MGSIESFLCENFEIMCDNDLEKHHSRGRRPKYDPNRDPNRPPKPHRGGRTAKKPMKMRRTRKR